MTKLFRLLSMTFIAVIVFCYGMNILLTNQVNTINTQQSSIAIRAFDTATTELTMPPWYNPILSGHHIISKDGTDYLLIKVTDNQFITAQASSLISATILSPANFILLILIGLFFTWYLGKQLNSKREKLLIAQLNLQTHQVIDSFNIQLPELKHATEVTRLSQAINALTTHVANYARETQTSISQDKLTLLIDRHAYIEHLDRQLNGAELKNIHCALLFIDLDGFKQVNDSFGHSFGDEVLIQVAERLACVLRHHKLNDINPTSLLEQNLARLGGDEFSIFINNIDIESKTLAVAQHVLNEIERDFVLGNKLIKISASVGIAVYPESASTPHALLQMADVAMYRAKTDGRGIFKVYSPEMGNKMRRYHYLLEELRLAIACHNFHLSFQPIVHVEDCAIDYFEALVRWDHPVEGPISPVEFIPIAEESNLILELGDWIMLESCRQMAAWHNAGMRKVKISVNVSGIQLKHRPIHEWVMKKLAKTGLPPSSLMLEITESTLITASDTIINELEKLRKEGVTIAIDDFGTGFSSLSTLADLPIDVIKIDRLFIAQANENPKYNEILNSISELGTKLGLKIVAEGVEEIAQFELVKRMGIRCVQGYLVSRPQSSINVGSKVLQGNVNHIAATGTGVWNLES
ncbi:EAL domain-containing protein [Pseudoalteromonas sp. KG3]|uniref:putative bifunctional diguanylate cyclase/phosphodiesterase n=1 Tax=Pseudoalteromonas sp. KG3 TaxID=2951137 RepID=UPI00265B5093|nr:GGDEF domain-containing phosphodiesterase [Pseudoalteromonas sp. KG3]WKD26161.1 EAL domain-containing protein [Pseudoalteromonas sp. KG3]